jgi:hypothetical protein
MHLFFVPLLVAGTLNNYICAHIDLNLLESSKPNSHVYGTITPAVNITVSSSASYLHDSLVSYLYWQ